MDYQDIIRDWKQQKFKSLYWLEGEEDFFIDQVTSYAEHQLLPESERGFNLTVLYGKDTDWAAVINACRRYPMFAERQVVLLKEAQAMRDLLKLEAYIDNPLTSTIFVVAHKQGKIDGRSKMAKLIKERGVMLSTKKLYDNQLPAWVESYVSSQGLAITQKAAILLVDHIGNDLSRIANEIDKLLVNLPAQKKLTKAILRNMWASVRNTTYLNCRMPWARRIPEKCSGSLLISLLIPKQRPFK